MTTIQSVASDTAWSAWRKLRFEDEVWIDPLPDEFNTVIALLDAGRNEQGECSIDNLGQTWWSIIDIRSIPEEHRRTARESANLSSYLSGYVPIIYYMIYHKREGREL